MTLRPCLTCGEPSPSPRCPEHTIDTKAKTTHRGYGWKWQQISVRARKAQPFCSWCLATTDLTTDHSEAAWAAHNAGKPIKLSTLDVLCRSCNAKKGAAR